MEALKWDEVASSPEYQKLNPQQRTQAQLQYFSDVIAPQIPEKQRANVRFQFLTDVADKYDPTAEMSTGEKMLAGAGKAFNDLKLGVRQLAGDKSANSDVAEARNLEKPLMNTKAGIAGNIGGNIAALAPTAFIPGANTYTGAAAIGGLAGLLTPTTQDESKLQNTLMGAAAGAAGKGIGDAVGRVIRPVQPKLAPGAETLVNEATSEGIPLRASQVTGSKPLAITESVLENLPFTSKEQLAQKAAQKEAFNRAVLSRAGIEANQATPEVLAAQKAALGSQFEDIASKNAIDFNKGGVTTKLADIADEASRRLSHPGPITNTVDDILKDVKPNGLLDGTKYQGWRETLRRMSNGNDTQAHYASQIKKTLDQAFNSQISGADAKAWSEASRQYGNLKTILKAMGGPGLETGVSNISPAQLSSAVTNTVGREGKALGRGDLNTLSKVGRAFISENLPDSGTAQRQFYQNLLTGNVAGAIPGAAIGYHENGPEGAVMGAGIGAATMLAGPKLAQALLNSKAGQAYMTKGLLPLTPAYRQLLSQALRTGATGTAMTAMSK